MCKRGEEPEVGLAEAKTIQKVIEYEIILACLCGV